MMEALRNSRTKPGAGEAVLLPGPQLGTCVAQPCAACVAFSEVAQVFSAAALRVDVPGHTSMPMAEGALLSLHN